MKNIQQLYTLTIASILTFILSSSFINKTNSTLITTNEIDFINTANDDCDGYYPLSKGISFELTSYNKKDKIESIMNHEIIESKAIVNGIVAKSKFNISDSKGTPSLEATYEAKCQNGKYYFNLETIFSQLTSQYEESGMKITIEDAVAVIPNKLTIGDKLENTVMSINIASEVINMKITVTISDRVVIGKETITTPAGTYNCMIMTSTTTMKMGEMMTVVTSSKEWLSKGVGNVRTESFDKNGKLDTYTLLTKFSK